MGWNNKNGKHFGLVCATHDKKLGRLNLINAGLPLQEAVAFDRYLEQTANLDNYPDFPEWLTQLYPNITPTLPKSVRIIETHSVESLTLTPRIHNALRRNGITTIEELARTSDNELSRMRNLGVKGINEIHKQLQELGYE